ncbi:MAG: ABC transporter ATP-binding protein [Candidatus Eremiobacteraeota bacterium]|nr:ABC transporter ATP-binding protein [Candidatus Eremiobacteraeota bacterium]
MKVIELEGVWKKFRRYAREHRTLKETLIRGTRGICGEFWVLEDINFSVDEGECWGVMGANGAGKTTLFRLIARILQPTRGKISTSGRISAILDLGVGFHPDFTGRENIFTYGAILGVPSRELRARLDEIVAFSGLEDFLEEPLRSYSSGMAARLAFSVAVHAGPSIILLDEILTVGDRGFQRRCLEKLKALKSEGKTILIISHSPELLAEICPRSLLIEGHRLSARGETAEIARQYCEITRSEKGADDERAC